ncbi:hypothetical protein KI387_027562, partial [Taxus chinensis]
MVSSALCLRSVVSAALVHTVSVGQARRSSRMVAQCKTPWVRRAAAAPLVLGTRAARAPALWWGLETVEAEQQPEVSELYTVSAVPFFVFFKDGKVVDTLEGANPSELANKVAKVSGSISIADAAAPASIGMSAGPTVVETVRQIYESPQTAKTITESGDVLQSKLQQLVNSKPVMLFMKGTPEQPQCGFSKKVVDVLKAEGVEYGSFDVLRNEQVREELKAFSNWPTFPQLYCKGELLGGCDITLELHKSGELKQVFEDHGLLPIADMPVGLAAKETAAEPKSDANILESGDGDGGIADST